MDEIRELMIEMSDEELIEVIEKTYSDYTREALEIGMAELKRRGISFVDKSAYYPAPSEAPAFAGDQEVYNLMTEMSDIDLLEAIEENYSGYTTEALEIGIAELKRRGVSFVYNKVYYPAPDEDPALLEDNDEVVSDIYFCPRCKNKMEPGLLDVMSYVHCFFTSSGRMKGKVKVIDKSERKAAYRCRVCKLVVFESAN